MLEWCEQLLALVAGAEPRVPSTAQIASWTRRPSVGRPMLDGLEAMTWTIEQTGLAGPADLTGLPWRLDMDQFFEAWVESVVREMGRQHVASVRSGRLEQTRVPLQWSPVFAGSQRSLLPDIVLERADAVIVFDAKYKSHRVDLDAASWDALGESARESHRNDLLQALAYSTLFPQTRVVACLVYPFPPAAFVDLEARGRSLIRTRVPAGTRHVELALAALPLGGSPAANSRVLAPLLTSPLP